ncbi:MAG: helix-turn-helix domain-containing protein [Candidatus Thorarchaeota archaeon]
MPEEDADIPLIFEIGPATWRVLIRLLAIREPLGPREIARRLGMSSHTVALYHLDKLQEHEIVEKTDDGEYIVSQSADLGFLDNFLYIRYKVIPRVLVYAVLVTSLLGFYTLFVGFDYSVHSVFALTIGLISSIFLWAEVYRIWSGLS